MNRTGLLQPSELHFTALILRRFVATAGACRQRREFRRAAAKLMVDDILKAETYIGGNKRKRVFDYAQSAEVR
jgi:hypothetical protein